MPAKRNKQLIDTSSGFNTGSVKLEFRNAYSEFLTDEVRLEFRNERLSSIDFELTVQLRGEPLTIPNVIAFPYGAWTVTILPRKFRTKIQGFHLSSNEEEVLKQDFFVNPSRVTPIFPSREEYTTLSRWSRLQQVLPFSGSNRLTFEPLSDEQKAGALNLYAKMSHRSVSNVFQSVQEIFEVYPARFYSKVEPSLWDTVRELSNIFRPAPGTDHRFPRGWRRLRQHSSFKSKERSGNLQLTFANNDAGEWAIDADLDDHQGIRHAFDWIGHRLTGRDTHPYDIHEILVKLHEIDPGYRFT